MIRQREESQSGAPAKGQADMAQPTIDAKDTGPMVLVVDEVEETRDGIEKLLGVDGYRVEPARHETDAVARAARARPDLILLSLKGRTADLVAAAQRIRDHAALSDGIPVVIFSIDSLAEGAEFEVAANVHITRPDNFNQLRGLVRRLLER